VAEVIEDLGFEPEVSRMNLRDYQIACIQSVEAGWEKFSRQLIVMATGLGKCLARGTPVLMFNGEIKPVELIVPGDVLMGPDSCPRTVQSICSGREMMYRVSPVKGNSYEVNESHILSLKLTSTPKKVTLGDKCFNGGDVVNLTIREYLDSSKMFKHLAKGWRVPVDFRANGNMHPLIPPYMLGLWLGDGTATKFSISKPDPEIRQVVTEYAESIGHRIRIEEIEGKCTNYHVLSPEGSEIGRGKRPNMATNALIELGVSPEKHIPMAYKTALREDRLKLFAGLMDSDGSLCNGGYDYITISKRLADDVAFLARSLGFNANPKPCQKKCQTGAVGTYYRMCISGDLECVPCLIPRKKHGPRRQKKNVLMTGISVEPIGEGEYFGFEISGNDRLFLLGDFTVTHNTVVFSNLAKREVDRGGRVLIVAHTDELLDQAIDKLKRSTGLHADKEKADSYAHPGASVVVASIQTLARKSRLLGFRDDHFSLVIVDEAHRSLAESYQRVMRYFHFGAHAIEDEWEMPPSEFPTIHKAKILGVTATADRGDKRGLGEFYQYVAFDHGLLQAVRDGYLVRPIVRNVPIKIDLKGIRRMAGDYSAEDLAIRITPFLKAIAGAIKTEAFDRKTVVFTPSVETAKLISEACREVGLSSDFVSGNCDDRAEKIARFDKGPAGSVIACAMLLIEGWDCDTASCVCILRPTKIRSMYVQAVGRCTRPLSGLIDNLPTPDERLASISKSAKKDCMILDPLWLADRMDLIRPVDLVTTNPKVREKMIEDLDGDLVNAELRAERDLMKAVEKAAKQHSKKKSRTIDPLAFAVNVGDQALSSYEPQEPWEAQAPDAQQIKFLEQNGIDISKILCRGHAAKIEEKIKNRKHLGLCTPKQMNFLIKMGLPETEAALKSFEEAGRLIGRKMQQYRR
jgi:superfamily II DNA or RNA helicase